MRYLKNKLKQFILSIVAPILEEHRRQIELLIEQKLSTSAQPAAQSQDSFPPQIDIRVDRKSARR